MLFCSVQVQTWNSIFQIQVHTWNSAFQIHFFFEFQVYLKKSIVITLKGVFSYSYPVFLKLVLCAGTPQEVRLEQLWNKQNLKLVDNLPMKQQQGKGSCQHDRNIILLWIIVNIPIISWYWIRYLLCCAAIQHPVL